MRLPKRVNICGQDYSVLRVTPRTPRKALPPEWKDDTDGYWLAAEKRILVKAYPKNAERELDSLVHELQHAALDASGAGRFLKANREEDFLHTYTPALIATLKAAKVIR